MYKIYICGLIRSITYFSLIEEEEEETDPSTENFFFSSLFPPIKLYLLLCHLSMGLVNVFFLCKCKRCIHTILF